MRSDSMFTMAHRRDGDIGALYSVAQFAELRRACFAALGDSSEALLGLGVSAERIARHLAQGSRGRSRRPLQSRRLDLAGVALATACVDKLPGAWSMMISDVESPLVDAAEPYEGQTLAVISVRRFLIELRRVNRLDASSSLSLRRYTGRTSLRRWLTDRLLVRVGLTSGGLQTSPAKHVESCGSLQLAMELLQSERKAFDRRSDATGQRLIADNAEA